MQQEKYRKNLNNLYSTKKQNVRLKSKHFGRKN
jgi:hypothetical protein